MAIEWHGDRVEAVITAHVGQVLDRAGFMVSGRAKRLINLEGTAKSGKGKRAKLKYNANPSLPGEPPHKQTGQLQGSVTVERVGMIVRIGSNLKKALYLEIGTKKMKARPWLRRALLETKGAIESLFHENPL